MIKKHSPYYRWYVLGLASLAYALVIGAARMCMPMLFQEIGIDLNLSATAIGTIWGMDPLAGVFIGLPAGLLADRFGVKRTLVVLCILAGITEALRGFSVNFFTMTLTMFLFGFMAAALPSVVPKVITEWFSGKHLALANAIVNFAAVLGSIAATMTAATLISPWLGGWKQTLFFFGIPPLLIGFLILFTMRDTSKNEFPKMSSDGPAVNSVPFKKAISHVIKIKDVWILGIITSLSGGCSMGFMGYLPYYLQNNGWSAATASNVMTVFNLVSLLGSIPMVLLSDKLKTRKGVLLVSLLVTAAGVPLVPFGGITGVWIFVILIGVFRSGAGSLFNVMILEAKGVGSLYSGTASGLASSIGMIGGALGPPIGNSLKVYGQAWPFIFWGFLVAAGIPLLLLIKTAKSNTKDPYSVLNSDVATR
jgi:sugar phosphate permease